MTAVYTDIRWKKIYNKLTFPAAAAGLLLNGLQSGWMGVCFSAKGFAVAFGVMLTLALLTGGGIGGGDIKLMAAVGALRGSPFVFWAMLYTAVVGGLIAVVYLLFKGLLKHTLQNIAVTLFQKSMGASSDMAAASKGGRLSYALAIALGTLGAVCRLGL